MENLRCTDCLTDPEEMLVCTLFPCDTLVEEWCNETIWLKACPAGLIHKYSNVQEAWESFIFSRRSFDVFPAVAWPLGGTKK